MSKPDLSVIIATCARYDALRDAIQSIAGQQLGDDSLEIVVVDNSSRPIDFSRELAGLATGCTYIYIQEGILGLSHARNVGVAASSADIVAFLDDDAIAMPGWATEIIGQFVANASMAVLGGAVRPIWPEPRPRWLDPNLESYFTALDLGGDLRELRDGEWLAGTNIAFRKAPLVSVGGFNERLGRVGGVLLSNEELAVCGLISAAGLKLLYDPKMIVNHYVHASRMAQGWLRRRVFWQVVSNIVASPASDFIDQPACIRQIMEFMNLIPFRYRGPSGFFVDVTEPDIFTKQIAAIAALTQLMASQATDWGDLPGKAT